MATAETIKIPILPEHVEKLDQILLERRLEICPSNNHSQRIYTEAEQLGIFDLSKIAYLLEASIDANPDNSEESIMTNLRLYAFCLNHYPDIDQFLTPRDKLIEVGKVTQQTKPCSQRSQGHVTIPVTRENQRFFAEYSLINYDDKVTIAERRFEITGIEVSAWYRLDPTVDAYCFPPEAEERFHKICSYLGIS
ncbi:MAG: hypothetical protein V1808_01920 [Candidatus Daviesbacteria bacterium]